jgi:hypothetical protein
MPLTYPDELQRNRPVIYRVRELRYFLVEGETLWLRGLRIIDSRLRFWGDREVIIYALGTSHALTLRHQDRQVSELLSCEGRFDAVRCLAELAADNPFEVSTLLQGLRYRFRLTLHNLAGDDALLGAYSREDAISVAYPQQAGFETPVTRIGWRIDPGVLRLETLHTYPEESCGVRTESLIELA